MNNVSFIISIDGSYEMINNFFEKLLKNKFVSQCEVVIVEDCVENIRTLNYLVEIKNTRKNINLISLQEKVGYGKANNIGVKESSNDYMFFINTDVFADEQCFRKMLFCLEHNHADCVQPLLLWPQNNRIQCAGTFFGPYYKKHLFAGRKPESIDLSRIPSSRQALTSALYAMKKDTFIHFGGFDEFYYNKLESFELSLKLTQAGKRCICLTDAIAYHSQGTGRNQYYFDFYQQEAFFWTRFGSRVVSDIDRYYRLQILDDMLEPVYHVIAITQTRNVKQLIDSLRFNTCSYTEINGINPSKINLYEVLPHSIHKISSPIIFFVENITNLLGNSRWFMDRKKKDIAMDTYGNLLYIDQI